MLVRELIEKLQKLPGDYSVGIYRASVISSPQFVHLDIPLGVNNEMRRVALSHGISAPATTQEMADTFELS